MVPEIRESGPSSSSTSRVWPSTVLLIAAVVGIASLATIAFAGPPAWVDLAFRWLPIFLVLLVGASLWWSFNLWLLSRLGGWSWREGVNRSAALAALLSVSLLLALAVSLDEKFLHGLGLGEDVQSACRWLAGVLAFVVFLGQELVLAEAAQRKDLRDMIVSGLHGLGTLPSRIVRLPGLVLRQVVHHPLLILLLAAGILPRWQDVNMAHPGDMNDTLAVVYTLLTWPPFRYYHNYQPQTFQYAHLPVFPMMMAPFYWLFENVMNLPTPWSAKLVSAVADLATATLIYSAVKGRLWKNSWGLLLAGAFLFSPWVIDSNDHATCLAAAFTVAAYASAERSWQCGILMGLGAATRNESVFLALPLVVHFLARRAPREKVAFLGAFSTVVVAAALPFFLFDPGAMDYAMRVQTQRQSASSNEMSRLLEFLLPLLSAGAVSFIQRNAGLQAIAVVLPASLLAIRDVRVSRVVLVVALLYLLGLPVLHDRYMVWAYAGGLYYAARYGNPLVAAAVFLAFSPGNSWSSAVQLALAAALAAFGLLQIYWPRKVNVRAAIG